MLLILRVEMQIRQLVRMYESKSPFVYRELRCRAFNTRGSYTTMYGGRVRELFMLRHSLRNCVGFGYDNAAHRVMKHGLRFRYAAPRRVGKTDSASGVLLPFILHTDLFPQWLKRSPPSECSLRSLREKFRHSKKLTAVSLTPKSFK